MPVPASVVTIPEGENFRMLAPALSQKYTFPEASLARPLPNWICARTAGPLSPEECGAPATVWIVPVAAAITRIVYLMLSNSAMSPFTGLTAREPVPKVDRSEEHTSELQSLRHLV